MDVLKVAARSNPNSVAGAPVGALREKRRCPESGHKGCDHCLGGVSPAGVAIVCFPALADIQVEGQERTAMKIIIGRKTR